MIPPNIPLERCCQIPTDEPAAEDMVVENESMVINTSAILLEYNILTFIEFSPQVSNHAPLCASEIYSLNITGIPRRNNCTHVFIQTGDNVGWDLLKYCVVFSIFDNFLAINLKNPNIPVLASACFTRPVYLTQYSASQELFIKFMTRWCRKYYNIGSSPKFLRQFKNMKIILC
jgi:hypothetical protein